MSHFMTKLTTAIFVALAAVPALAGDGFLDRNGGSWRGVGVQDDGQSWAISVAIFGNTIAVDYPSVPCSGIWELIREDGERLVVRERITEGLELCIDLSNVVLQEDPADGQLIVRWYEPGPAVYAFAILKRPDGSAGDPSAMLVLSQTAVGRGQTMDPKSTALANQYFGF